MTPRLASFVKVKKEFSDVGLDVAESVKLWENNQKAATEETTKGTKASKGTEVSKSKRTKVSKKHPSLEEDTEASKKRTPASKKGTQASKTDTEASKKRTSASKKGTSKKGTQASKTDTQAPNAPVGRKRKAGHDHDVAPPAAGKRSKKLTKAHDNLNEISRDNSEDGEDQAPPAKVIELSGDQSDIYTHNTIEISEEEDTSDEEENTGDELEEDPAAKEASDEEDISGDEEDPAAKEASDEEDGQGDEEDPAAKEASDEEDGSGDEEDPAAKEASDEDDEDSNTAQAKFALRDNVLGFFAARTKDAISVYPGKVIKAQPPNSDCDVWTYSVMFVDETCNQCYWRSNDDLDFQDVESVATQNGHALHPEKSKTFICECDTSLLNSEVLQDYDPDMLDDLDNLEKKVDSALAKKMKLSNSK
jgi:hypothetical protein